MLFNEPKLLKSENLDKQTVYVCRFSALQRAEIAEMLARRGCILAQNAVSVLFNEPKLLKSRGLRRRRRRIPRFSALQRAEIAEIQPARQFPARRGEFQCSSTSRNC